MTSTVLVAGARTPIGKILGGLATVAASGLGSIAISASLERSGIPPELVDAAIFGNVIQAGVGPNPARRAAFAGGLSMNIPATTVNKLCLSGMTAMAQADAFIRSGHHRTIVAGGFESMSLAPFLARNARTGFKFGGVELEDSLERDALIDAFEEREVMGAATERHQ